jgi:DNA gyrase subunit B
MAEYDQSAIKVLKGFEAVRMRPGMYIGDTDTGAGMHHMLWEVVGNCIDEHLRGGASVVSISIDGDFVTVEDDGRGIPVGPARPGADTSIAEMVMTSLSVAGTRFGESPHVHLSSSLHGVGVAVVNALSSRFEVDIWRAGHHYQLAYEMGEPKQRLRELGGCQRSGTRISFQDEEIHCTNGLADHVAHLTRNERGEPRPPLHWTGEHDKVRVEVALQWTDAADVRLSGFVSQARTREGTHLAGFWDGVRRALEQTDAARIRGIHRRELCEALGPGLVAVVHAALYDPVFGNPTKDRLDSPEARVAVSKIVGDGLGEHLSNDRDLREMLLARFPSA